MKKVKLGFVGAGFNGQIGFLENFYKNKNCIILGLAEYRRKLRRKVCKKYNILNQYNSHRDLEKDIKEYDGIVIVTKRNMMPAITYNFLKLGKPILTEKPMAMCAVQANKLLKRSQKYQTQYKVGYNKTYDEGIIKAKQAFDKIIKNKSLGKIVLMRSHRLSGSGYDNKNFYFKTSEKNFLNKPSWPSKPRWLPGKFSKSYEKYLNLYCHNISLLRYFTNEIPKVEKAMLSDDKMSIVNLKYKKFNAILETGFFTKHGWDETLEIYFEFGSILIKIPPQHHKNKSASFIINKSLKGSIYKFKSKKSWSFKNQCDAFVNDIKNKKIKINKANDSVKDIELVEKIWKNFLNS